LTRDFKETIQVRVREDPDFRRSLFEESIEQLLGGDADVGKAVLRDYINATVGFEVLAQCVGKSSKSLMRMLGPGGNPQINNLLAVIRCLQDREGVRFEVNLRNAR
jgi:DNA-binding phage protein